MCKTLLILLSILSFNLVADEKKDSILNILNNQVEAFNQKDLIKLVDGVTDDFVWYFLTPNEMITETSGKAEFKEVMQKYLKIDLNSHSKIIDYTIHNNIISFKEEVTYLTKKGNKETSTAMGIYQIEGNKIARAWYFVD